MQALLDLDIFIFRAAAASENEDLDIAIARMNDSIQGCLDRVGATSYRGFISGENNYRYKINPEYKANRKDKADPRWRQDLKAHAIREWSGEVTFDIEADDALGINQHEGSIIVSIDKDLRQIPGLHYSFELSGVSVLGKSWTRPEEFVTVNEFDGNRFFYSQLLIGDKADNIIGIGGIGPVKAERALGGCETVSEMFDIVRDMYDDDDRLMMNARCLWICRKKEDDWLDTEQGASLLKGLVLKTA